MVVLSTEQKLKFWIAFLLVFCHIFKFRSISCHKFSKLVNNISLVTVSRGRRYTIHFNCLFQKIYYEAGTFYH